MEIVYVYAVFDGLENPLARLADEHGFFLPRGMDVDALDRKRKWAFEPLVAVGDTVRAGHFLGRTSEGHIDHKIMGLGGDVSWFPCVYPSFLIPPKEYSYRYVILRFMLHSKSRFTHILKILSNEVSLLFIPFSKNEDPIQVAEHSFRSGGISNRKPTS